MRRDKPKRTRRQAARAGAGAQDAPAALAELGTAGYPPKTRRRLRNVNVACYTIAISCALFALTYAQEDPALFRNPIIINLDMMVAALMVPAVHRVHEVAGAALHGRRRHGRPVR